MRSTLFASSLALLLAATQLPAQTFTTGACPANKDGGSWYNADHRACELRTATLPLVNGHLAVSGKNGSIDVVGEDRSDIVLEAQVSAQAPSTEEAEAIVHKIDIVTTGEIRANGPETSGWMHRGWSVAYHLRVPRHLAAHLHTENGSVKLSELDGAITAETTNGSMTLSDLAGDVKAQTTNGSLRVALRGNRWAGAGLSATTTNGSVSVSAPSDYSAHLLADTTNGGFRVDFPNANPSGDRDRHSRHLDTTIGQGGPTLRFETVNGSVHIDRN